MSSSLRFTRFDEILQGRIVVCCNSVGLMTLLRHHPARTARSSVARIIGLEGRRQSVFSSKKISPRT